MVVHLDGSQEVRVTNPAKTKTKKTIQGIGFSSHPKYAGKFSYSHETYETCTDINRLEGVRGLSRANGAD
jgi:hypothetical protein